MTTLKTAARETVQIELSKSYSTIVVRSDRVRMIKTVLTFRIVNPRSRMVNCKLDFEDCQIVGRLE